MLYAQNGDRIVTIDSATSIHPMYKRVVCNWVDSLQASSLSKVSTVSVNLPSAFKEHFRSRPRSLTLSLIPGKLVPTSSGSWSDFITWTTLEIRD